MLDSCWERVPSINLLQDIRDIGFFISLFSILILDVLTYVLALIVCVIVFVLYLELFCSTRKLLRILISPSAQ